MDHDTSQFTLPEQFVEVGADPTVLNVRFQEYGAGFGTARNPNGSTYPTGSFKTN